jgi:phage repressor protein C with HTH and peptisase S24 domain
MMTLKERIDALMREKEWDIATVARIAGVSHSAVSQWLGRGNSTIREIKNPEAAAKLAEATGYNSLWIATGKGEKKGPTHYTLEAQAGFYNMASMEANLLVAPKPISLTDNPDYPAIRRVKVKAQAGVTGFAVEYMDEDGPPIVFRKDWYTQHGYQPKKMIALRVSGESMAPSLYSGDLIVANTAQSEAKDGIAFVVAYEGEVVVKRLVRDAGQWWLTSDNPDQRRFPRKVCDEHTQVIGEVVYRQTERI